MRKRRSEAYNDKTIGDLLRENTYGGSKTGRHARRHQMPVVVMEDGIKIEWDGHPEEYPPVVKLKMTDGEWITYQIKVAQPVFSPALEDVANMKRGYPPERS